MVRRLEHAYANTQIEVQVAKKTRKAQRYRMIDMPLRRYNLRIDILQARSWDSRVASRYLIKIVA